MNSMLCRILYLAFCAALPLAFAAAGPADSPPGPGDPQGPVLLTRHLATDILLDQKTIWTSPFHINRHTAPLWIGFAAATAALMATDHQSAAAIPQSGASVRAGNDFSRLGATYSVASFAGGFYAIGLITHNTKARETGFLAGEALIDTAIVVQALKFATGRVRPISPDTGEFFDRGASFPSGHAIAAWSLASVVAHEYGHHKYVPVLAYGLAAVVSSARFTSRQHYASDVLAGSAMGYFIGRYVYEAHQPRSDSRGYSLTPILDPASRSYGLSVRVGL
jgi:membrane-associated phospholipid phosphatase